MIYELLKASTLNVIMKMYFLWAHYVDNYSKNTWFEILCLKYLWTIKNDIRSLRYIFRCFVEGGCQEILSYSEKLPENEPKNNMHFCVKTLKLDNIPLIRYKMIWSQHVQVIKQHIRLYQLQLWIYSKNKKLPFLLMSPE